MQILKFYKNKPVEFDVKKILKGLKVMNKLLQVSIVCGATALLLNGCGNTQESVSSVSDVSELRSEIEVKNDALKSKEQQIARLEAILNEKAANNNSNENNSLLPPNAKAGECYSRVLIPASYTLKQERVLKQEASQDIKIVPATYRTTTKRVLANAESYKLVTIPATYKYVTQKIQVEPAKTQIIEVPARYKTVTEKVLIKPAYTTWKKGRGEVEKVNHSTGEIMCLVEVPAEYKSVTKRVLVNAAGTKKITTPPVYKTVKVKVENTPATTKKIVIPATYTTIRVKEVSTPAKELTTTIPATYQTVTKRVLTKDSELKWQPILCETNTTPTLVRDLQIALKREGYNVGPIDSIYGSQTKTAVKAYQKDKRLAIGALTLETLKSLKVL
ncbi:MAG: Retron-type RNA-directed DNA polymerase (EC [uncultured Campylobacterales bacterium]|uniref:Retron-type RNA-directed DNA polymerase (EC) n=1 Tax=uncultured Campylobacterales bacterium TaxID=352960 RepID=A0A6S6T0C8_9BACT|nr:MAG: Retron-type RNA-directed DNA polymerase (EC [uncultured Campylobacterales bacterium]